MQQVPIATYFAAELLFSVLGERWNVFVAVLVIIGMSRQAVIGFFKPRRSVLISWLILAAFTAIAYFPPHEGRILYLWSVIWIIWLYSILPLIGLVMAFPMVIPFTIIYDGNIEIKAAILTINLVYNYLPACVLALVIRKLQKPISNWFDSETPQEVKS